MDCPICSHPERAAIERDIRAGIPYARIGRALRKQLGLYRSPETVARYVSVHVKEHMT